MTEIKSVEIRCLTCGTWFPSPVFIGTLEMLESAQMSGNMAQCPNGHMTPCNKENMRARGPDGGFIGNDTV